MRLGRTLVVGMQSQRYKLLQLLAFDSRHGTFGKKRIRLGRWMNRTQGAVGDVDWQGMNDRKPIVS